MLKLTNITKDYVTGPSVVHALKGIDLEFRENEFVAILGPSGCGKTTLLNIIGGLDRYTDGDLVINGKSTKTFKDREWDTYRNHSIGFVFQSYNLIPHQTVLANVELALTLSGVSKNERKQRAIEALEKVGLGDQLHKKPSQMSGGQMQRVAIARALVNDPDILLADEPTGALDTATSVQVMEILKEISKDKLIIMVTHNPELADAYATRIVRVVDGLVTDDTDPYTATEEEVAEAISQGKESEARKSKNKKKTSMSFFTALSLSLNNLATKKGRTIMTSFAGSIGIIGIALILALSNGINLFIAQIQEDTLSTYPLSIQRESQDMSAMLSAMTTVSDSQDYKDTGKIYVDNSMGNLLSAMNSTVSNDLVSFKEYLDAHYADIEDYVSDVQYTYDYDFQIYNLVTVTDENGKEIVEARKVGMETIFNNAGDAFAGMSELMEMGGSAASIDVFSEMIDNQELLDQQYEVIHGDWPSEANEVVLVVNSNNQLSRMTLYMLGVLDPDNIQKEMNDVLGIDKGMSVLPEGTESESSSETETEEKFEDGPFEYEFFTGMTLVMLTNSDFYYVDNSKGTYSYNGNEYPIWSDFRENNIEGLENYISQNGTELKISGIIRPKAGATATSISGAIGYTHKLTELMLSETANSKIINQQKETPKNNVLTGMTFERTHYTPENIHELVAKIPESTMKSFYPILTEMIRGTEEYLDMLDITTVRKFIGIYALLPEEQQLYLFEKLLDSAASDPKNQSALATIYSLIAETTGGMISGESINADNLIFLLPALDQTAPLLALNGISGLPEIAGVEGTKEVCEVFTAKTGKQIDPANFAAEYAALESAEDRMFLTLLMIDKANEIEKESVEQLCQIINMSMAQMPGFVPYTADTLKENVQAMDPNNYMQFAIVSFFMNGVDGLVDLASDEVVAEVYAETYEIMKSLTIDEKIFLTILENLRENDPTFKTLEATLYSLAPQVDETYASILKKLDNQEEASPASVNFYAKDFDSKEKIEEFIGKYNDEVNKKYIEDYKAAHGGKEPEDKSPKEIQYSDVVGALMSSVTTIVNVISYVLIAFVAISLVVSSIMIGIITNISVLERTKEIGILRAVGASKKDVSRVFNAETVIIGFCAGTLGVVVTALLCIPTSLILRAVTGFDNITASVPLLAGVILVLISVLLTMIAGIIPARSAAKKDPVIALRSE